MTAHSFFITSLINTFSTFLEKEHLTPSLQQQILAKFVDYLSQKADATNFEAISDLEDSNFDELEKKIITKFLNKYEISETSIFCNQYISELVEGQKSQSTIKNYRSDITQFFSFCKTKKISETITKFNIKNFVQSQIKTGLKESSIKRKLVSIGQFVLWAENNKIIQNTYFWISQPDEFFRNNTNHPNNYNETNAKYSQDKTNNLENLIYNFLASTQAQNASESTVKNYRSDLFQMLFVIDKDTTIENFFSRANLEKIINIQKQKGLKDSTIKRKLSVLKQLAGFARHNSQLNKFDNYIFELELEELKNNQNIDEKSDQSKPDTISKKIALPLQSVIKSSDKNTGNLKSSLENFANQINQRARNLFLPYLNAFLILLFLIGFGYFGYVQFVRDVDTPFAFPTAPVRPNRELSFQGRLTDTAQNPITTATNMEFRLYDTGPGTGGTLLWDSGTCSVTPDQDGIFNTGLGDDCGSEITSDVFTENANVWLEVQIVAETLTPRQSIKTVAYALNSETVQGYPISSTEAATINTILTMNEGGEVVLAEIGPTLRSTNGTFSLEGQTLSLETSSGSNGNVILAPNGTGISVSTRYFAAPAATFSATYAGGKALVVKGGPSGTANIQEWQDSTGSELVSIDADGGLGLNTAAGSYILNVNGASYFSDAARFQNEIFAETVPEVGNNNKVLTVDGSDQISYIDSTAWDKDASNDLSGSGTTNYLARWTGGTALGNSLIYDNSTTSVGIGTILGTSTFNVQTGAGVGKALVMFNETGDQDILAASASGTTRFRMANNGYFHGERFSDLTNSSYYLDPAGATSLLTAGNIGIGTTTANTIIEALQSKDATLRLTSTKNDSSWVVDTDTIGAIEYYGNDASGGGANVYGFTKLVTEATAGNLWSMTFGTSSNNAAATEKMRITSGGNVGIGTTTPSTNKLEIYSTSTDAMLRLNGGAAGNPYIDFAQGGTQKAYLQYVDSGDYLRIVDNGVVGIVLKSGQVGVNTTTPQGDFHVGDDTTSGVVIDNRLSSISSKVAAQIAWAESGTYLAGDLLIAPRTSGAEGSVRFFTGSSPTEKVTIMGSNGNVGIGATTASQKLDVSGEIELANYLYFGNAATEYLRWDGSNFIMTDDLLPVSDGANSLGADGTRWDSLYVKGASIHIGDSGDEGIIGYNTTSNLISLDANADATPEFAVLSGGNVGIGTTTTAGTLHIKTGSSIPTIVLAGNNLSGESNIRFMNNAASTEYVSLDGSLSGLVVDTSGSITMKPNNVQSMFLATDGNVGIGTASPLAKFSVDGATIGKALAIFNETGNQDIFSASASGTSMFTIKRDGNVGIGTTAPSVQLENYSTTTGGSATVQGRKSNLTYTFNSTDGSVNLYGDEVALTTSSSGATNDAGGSTRAYYANITSSRIAFSTTNYLGFDASITETGGIGSGNSSTKNLYGFRGILSSSAGNTDAVGTDNVNVYGAYLTPSITTSANTDAETTYGVYVDASGGKTANYSFYGNAGNFYNSGNVGIGTTAITDIYSGFSGQTQKVVDIQGTSASTDAGFASLILSRAQSGTAQLVGAIHFANTSLATAEKRIAQIHSTTTNSETDSGILGFATMNNGTFGTRMTILHNGNVGIGTVTPELPLDVEGNIEVGTGTDGCVRDADNTSIAGACSSDINLKTNIISFDKNGLETINNIDLVYYNWKNNVNGEKQLGVIAQQVESIAPELVVDGSDGYKKVHFEYLPFYTIKAIQQQQQIINNSNTQLALLDNKTTNIENTYERASTVSSLASRVNDLADKITTLEDQKANFIPTLAEVLSTKEFEASDSADLNLKLSDIESPTTPENIVITASSMFIDQYFRVNGAGYIADSLGIGNILYVGNGMKIADGVIAYNTADNNPILKIQPEGKGKIDFLDGKMIIADTGLVTIDGDLEVKGDLKVEKTILTNLLKPTTYDNPFQVQVAGINTENNEVRKSRFEIINEVGTPVATFSAEGNAEFAGKVSVAGRVSARDGIELDSQDLGSSDNNSFETSKSSGKATLKAGAQEVIIKSEKISANSLIYITPIGSTGNKVLYVRGQVAENKETAEKEGQFSVGFDSNADSDVSFNWWVVN